MPERDLLADLLSMKVELRSTEGRAALRALDSICRQKGHVAYRKSFMPIEDRCICGVKIERFDLTLITFQRRRQKSLSVTYFADLCLNWDSWFRSENEWQDHCLEHLNTPGLLPLRCDLLIFRNVPINAGFCLFFLGDSSLPAKIRMKQYLTNKSEWIKEMESRLVELEKTNSTCECAILYAPLHDNVEELRFIFRTFTVTTGATTERVKSETSPNLRQRLIPERPAPGK
ncbi:hypothetical protein ACJ73_09798 [Blastomyces percursus]|uniref:Uncharacterized protein n=1 Tax=Blastomyces percursus TaxID=1658174 RepID=A0A1J9Q5J9_9EURO|nr:hypothetical protein ACJ73_09798 [Blastomyces percursus]